MEEKNRENSGISRHYDSAGKGLAFLGMLIFLFNIMFYVLSRGQPSQYHLFADSGHLIIMSIISLILVISGYALTRLGGRPAELVPRHPEGD